MKEKKTVIFIAVMTILCVLFLVNFLYRPLGTQNSLFFSGTNDYMADYYNVAKYSATRDPYCYGMDAPSPERAYPPLAYIISYFQSRFANYIDLSSFEAGKSTMGLLSSSFCMFLETALLVLLLYDANKHNKITKCVITILLVFSSITLFSFERGNMIIIAAVCSTFFVLNYNNSNAYVREMSYFALAIAAGLKAYPALLGVLLLFDRQYKRAFRLVIYGIIIFFVPFLFFKGGFYNLPIMIQNLQLNSLAYSKGIFPRFNFRLWAARITIPEMRQTIYQVFSVIDGVLCVIAVGLSAFQPVRWKKYMLLLLILVILPVNSAQYAGLYLLIGVVLFLNEKTTEKSDWLYLILMILFLNPFQIIWGGINITQYAMNLSVSLMFVLLFVESFIEMIKWRKCKKVVHFG